MIGDFNATVPAAQLVTRDSGWALTTDRLAWTGDGGRSWRTITPGKVPAAQVRGAFFLDPRTGWVVTSARRRETGSRVQLAVYRTRDAGATWQRSSLGQLDLGGDNAAGGYEGGFGVLALPSFVDQRHGWVAVQTSSDTYEAHSFLFRTTDGGATWTPRYVPLAEEDEEHGLLPLAAADRTTMVALVGHEARKLLTSRDGGRRWVVGGTGLEGRYPAVRGVAFADPGTGWAVTGRGTSLPNGCYPQTPRCDDRGVLLRTTDGGTSWSEATPGR